MPVYRRAALRCLRYNNLYRENETEIPLNKQTMILTRLDVTTDAFFCQAGQELVEKYFTSGS